MTIVQMIKEGFHYARSCKSLWLFGFVVALASGGSSGGGSGGNGGGVSVGAAGISFGLERFVIVPLVVALILMAVGVFVLRFISEGALIEGVVRARQGQPLTTGEGFRAGLAHWGVLLRIGLLYVAATLFSLVAIALPGIAIVRAFDLAGGIIYGIPAFFIAVPWLVTLYLVQAFAFRVAVLENRNALDAIHKARLFLHGRLKHGLRLIVASFVGTLALGLLGVLVMVPLAIVCIFVLRVLPLFVAIVVVAAVALPAVYVLTAMIGTLRSSIWTVGYLTEAES